MDFICFAGKQHDPISVLERSYQLPCGDQIGGSRRKPKDAVAAVHGRDDGNVGRAVTGGGEKWTDSRSILHSNVKTC